MLRNKILLLFTVLSISSIAQNNAQEIFNKAISQLATDNIELSMNVEETDSKGRVKSKSFDIAMAKFGKVEKTKIIMQQPERAKGVTIIITNSDDDEGYIEVFTPANGKTRKMKATAENMALVGFDFFMTDFSSIDKDDISHRFVEKLVLNDKNCYKLEIGSKKNSSGDKAEMIIEEDTYQIFQIKMFDSADNLLSITELSDYQTVPGVKDKIQALHIVTEDLKSNKKSDIKITYINYRSNFVESEFNL